MRATPKVRHMINLTNASTGGPIRMDYFRITNVWGYNGHTVVVRDDGKKYFIVETPVEVCLSAGDIKRARAALDHGVAHDG